MDSGHGGAAMTTSIFSESYWMTLSTPAGQPFVCLLISVEHLIW